MFLQELEQRQAEEVLSFACFVKPPVDHALLL
jgi:hypothetical protein